jgi:hypothetical protein
MKFATEVPIDGGGSILIELPVDSRLPSPEGLIPAGNPLDKSRQAVAQASVVVLEEASTSLNQSLDSITDFAHVKIKLSWHASADADAGKTAD